MLFTIYRKNSKDNTALLIARAKDKEQVYQRLINYLRIPYTIAGVRPPAKAKIKEHIQRMYEPPFMVESKDRLGQDEASILLQHYKVLLVLGDKLQLIRR